MSPPKENATRQGGALRTAYDERNLPDLGRTLKEFADDQSVNIRTVGRWLKAGKLIITRTPGGRPRIHGVKP